MRILILLYFIFILAACGENSSPEGRMTIKLTDIQKEVDSLKKQNAVILDSLTVISEELRKIKGITD
jgi:hypothetical protein